VTLTDSSRFVLQQPWVSADTIGGGRPTPVLVAGAWKLRPSPWTAPLSSLQRLEARESDPTRSVLLGMTAAIGGGVAIALAVAMSNWTM
jgi:hypothetical protein